jgi:hypothetical protein
MNKKIFLLVVTVLCLTGCKKEAKIKLPPADNKLVVTCFISPGDSVVTAAVQSSKPKYTQSFFGSVSIEAMIQDATVILSDGTTSIQLAFNTDYFFYKANTSMLPIVSGKTYYLSVSTPDGKKADAQTTIPSGSLEIASLDTKIKAANRSPNFFEFDLNMTVNDISNVTNYVEIHFETVTAHTSSIGFPPVTYIDTSFISYTTPYFDTDEKISKIRYSCNLTGAAYISNDTIKYSRVDVSVLNCNKDFYLYNQSVELARYSGSDPFSNPVQVYSNINNGFGCFGSYIRTQHRQRIL